MLQPCGPLTSLCIRSTGDPIKTQVAGPHPRDSDSGGPGPFASLPGDAADACQWLNLEKHCPPCYVCKGLRARELGFSWEVFGDTSVNTIAGD